MTIDSFINRKYHQCTKSSWKRGVVQWLFSICNLHKIIFFQIRTCITEDFVSMIRQSCFTLFLRFKNHQLDSSVCFILVLWSILLINELICFVPLVICFSKLEIYHHTRNNQYDIVWVTYLNISLFQKIANFNQESIFLIMVLTVLSPDTFLSMSMPKYIRLLWDFIRWPSPWYSWKIAELALNNITHSLIN